MRRWPWLTLSLTGLGLLASLAARGPGTLEYDRARVAGGEVWRILTGQIVHWTARMTAADLGAVLVLGSWIEWRSRRLAALALAAGAVLIGLGIQFVSPGLERYRGASGLASALFVAGALELARRRPGAARGGIDPAGGATRLAATFALALFVVKVTWEMITGRALFAGPLPPGVEVVPLVHLLGAFGGIAGFAAHAGRDQRPAGAPCR